VQSNTKDGLESLMLTHSLSHETESQMETKDKKESTGNIVVVVAGLIMFILGATLVLGTLWQNSKKKGL